MSDASIRKLLTDLENDGRRISARAAEALRLLDELTIRDSPVIRCRHCGVGSKSERQLAEHIYNTHDGPLPAHYEAIEAKAATDWTPDEAPNAPRTAAHFALIEARSTPETTDKAPVPGALEEES